ncbi:UNVERIFIED_CONTAM: hypothetical protein Slati_2923900 [Sesamum latifolium]|uniref:Gag-pol polyprotein n=1 Tax=Sesamum latifolium TaxID=2727402 RepID=A0AAW2VE03_9LAMI
MPSKRHSSGSKMVEGSSVQSHGVKMISQVKNLEDLKVGLDNGTYVDMILQSLLPSYNLSIINYSMNGLEKSIYQLINMLVQYKATTYKSVLAVLVGEVSTSKTKGKRAGCWKRKKEKGKAIAITASTPSVPTASSVGTGKEKGKVGDSQRSRAMSACITKEKAIGRGSAHNSSPIQTYNYPQSRARLRSKLLRLAGLPDHSDGVVRTARAWPDPVCRLGFCCAQLGPSPRRTARLETGRPQATSA